MLCNINDSSEIVVALGRKTRKRDTARGMSKDEFIYKLSLFCSESEEPESLKQAAGFQIYDLQWKQNAALEVIYFVTRDPDPMSTGNNSFYYNTSVAETF